MKKEKENRNKVKVYYMDIYDSNLVHVGLAVVSTKFLSGAIFAIMKDGYTVNIYHVRDFYEDCKVIEIHSK